MNRLSILLLLATISLFSCSKLSKLSDTETNTSGVSFSQAAVSTSEEEPQSEEKVQPPKFRTIDNSIGVVNKHDAQTVTLLNDDETVWMTFNYNYEELLPASYMIEDIIALFPTWKDSFEPWAFNIDYFLVFKCMAEDEDSYTVVVNENTLETKKLMKADGWNYQSWNQHLKEGAIISPFINFNNQLRESPNADSQVLFTDTESGAYDCLEVQGDWIKIHNFISDNDEEGWLRWKDGNQFLIEFYYSM